MSINDHPDIRAAFDGFWMDGLDIKHRIGSDKGKPGTSRELVITNRQPGEGEGCFRETAEGGLPLLGQSCHSHLSEKVAAYTPMQP